MTVEICNSWQLSRSISAAEKLRQTSDGCDITVVSVEILGLHKVSYDYIGVKFQKSTLRDMV